MTLSTAVESETGAAILPEYIVDIVRQLAEVRVRKRALSEQEDSLRSEIILQMEKRQATVGLTAAGSQSVSIVTQPRTKLNTKKLEAMYPDIYAELIETGETLMVKLG